MMIESLVLLEAVLELHFVSVENIDNLLRNIVSATVECARTGSDCNCAKALEVHGIIAKQLDTEREAGQVPLTRTSASHYHLCTT